MPILGKDSSFRDSVYAASCTVKTGGPTVTQPATHLDKTLGVWAQTEVKLPFLDDVKDVAQTLSSTTHGLSVFLDTVASAYDVVATVMKFDPSILPFDPIDIVNELNKLLLGIRAARVGVAYHFPPVGYASRTWAQLRTDMVCSAEHIVVDQTSFELINGEIGFGALVVSAPTVDELFCLIAAMLDILNWDRFIGGLHGFKYDDPPQRLDRTCIAAGRFTYANFPSVFPPLGTLVTALDMLAGVLMTGKSIGKMGADIAAALHEKAAQLENVSKRLDGLIELANNLDRGVDISVFLVAKATGINGLEYALVHTPDGPNESDYAAGVLMVASATDFGFISKLF